MTDVPVVARDGTYGTVPEADLPQAFKAGFTLATEQETGRAQAIKAAEDVFGSAAPVAAGVAGTARGLSLGLSDAAVTHGAGLLGGDQAKARAAEVLRGLEEGSPLTSAVTEVGGNVAPLLAGGGAVKALGAPVRGAAALGRGAEGLAARALGEGTSVLGRVGRSVLEGAAGGAGEMSAYGAGKALSESAIQNHDLTAEELLTAAGGAALFGAPLGAAFRGPVALGAEGARALGAGADYLSGAAERGGTAALARAGQVADGAGALAERARAAGERAVEAGRQAVEDAKAAAPGWIDRADKAVSDLATKAVDLQAASDEQAARATYGRKRFVQEAEAWLKAGPDGEPGGWAGVGRVLKDTGVIDREAGVAGNFLTPEDLLTRIEPALEKVGGAKGDLIRGSTGTVRASELATALEDTIGKVSDKAGFEGITQSLRSYRDSLYDKLGLIADTPKGPRLQLLKEIPVQELVTQRKALDDLVFRESRALDPNLRVDLMRDIRRGLSGVEEEALVRAGADPKELAKLNRTYQALRIAQDATEDSISRGAANRSVGLTDYMTGGFLGDLSGSLLVGGVGAMVNKIAREQGSAAASLFLEDVARTGSVRAAAEKAGRGIYDKAGPVLDPAMATLREQSAEAAARLKNAAVLERVARMSQGVRDDVRAAAARIAGVASGAAEDVRGAAARALSSAAAGARTAVRVAEKTNQVRRAAIGRGYVTAADYERRRKEVEDLQANPSLVSQRLDERFPGLGDAAPQIAGTMAARSAALVAYLHDKLPPQSGDPNTLTPMAKRPRSEDLTPAEFRWMKAVEVLDNPRVALHAVEDGRLMIDQAQALRVGYPEIFQSMRLAIIASIATRPPGSGALDYQRTLRLGLLFDAPTTRTLEQPFLAAMQEPGETPTGPNQQPGPKAQRPRARPLDLDIPRLPSEVAERGSSE